MAQTFKDYVAEQSKEGVNNESTINPAEGNEVKDSGQNVNNVTSPVPAAGTEAVNDEPLVTIDGKPRPLKNYEAELRRKFEKEKEDEIEKIKSQYSRPVQTQTQQPANYLEQIYQMAETERLTTGKDVPIQTIMQVANNISQRNLENSLRMRESAEKEKRNFKRSIRKDPDFADVEEEFDTLVDQLSPEQINPAVLDVVYNAARGKRWTKEREEKIRKQAKEDALKEREVLGAPVESQPTTGKPKSSLTPAQESELRQLNHESSIQINEAEYISMVKNKQNRFKAAGAKNVPDLMSDVMIR